MAGLSYFNADIASNDISIADNSSTALVINQSSNSYLTFDTTDGS